MFILQRILLVLPIAGFLAVIDKASWPFIAVISLPLIAAHYLPGTLITKKGNVELAPVNLSVKKFVPLLLVGATIFVLNTVPKKLEVLKCQYELAGQLKAEIPVKQVVQGLITYSKGS